MMQNLKTFEILTLENTIDAEKNINQQKLLNRTNGLLKLQTKLHLQLNNVEEPSIWLDRIEHETQIKIEDL